MRQKHLVLFICALTLAISACGDPNSDADKKPVNEICDGNSDCASGICYRKVCASSNPGANGASCSGKGECKSFVCQVGVCVGGGAVGGTVCRYNEECSSGVCSQGKCTYVADAGGPDASQPDAGAPDLAIMDGAVPDAPTPDQATPDGPAPDAPAPDQATPDLATPDQAIPDLTIPDLEIPDLAVPDLTPPDQLAPDQGCTGCSIFFKCYAKDAVNPQDSCYHCDPAKSTTAWTMFAGKGCVSTIAGGKGVGHVDGDALTARFGWIAGLALDNKKLYITTHGATTTHVRVLDLSTMKVSTLAGTGTPGFAEGAALTAAKFNLPVGIVVDSAGMVLVADNGNHRIRAIKNGQVATLAGNGSSGTTDGPFLTSNIGAPRGLTMDAAGDLYVTTIHGATNASVRKLDMKTSTVSTLYNVGAIYNHLTGIDLDGKGKAYLVHYDIYGAGGRVIRDLVLGTKVSTVFAGAQAGCVTGALAAARFKQAQALKIGGAGEIYVADMQCFQVKKIAGGQVTAVGSGASGDLDGPSATAKFGNITSIAVDPVTGKVYMGDSGNYSSWSKIKVYTP